MMLSKSDHSTTVKDDGDGDDDFQMLPQEMSRNGLVCCYKGFWFPKFLFQPLISIHKHFHARDTDIILSTFPKSGTTWLKALAFSIINRTKYSIKTTPLLHSNPHKLVPLIENELYHGTAAEDVSIHNMGSPRIFATHMPYEVLPETIPHSNCRVVYLSRDLLDVINSGTQFLVENGFYSAREPISLDEQVDTIIEGKHAYGPFCDHMLGYWNASIKNPNKAMFLKYEDLSRDAIPCIKKMADFLGYPFTKDEEECGVVEEITKLCSFENLKNLEANKVGKVASVNNAKSSSFFRQGKVGDWKNHLIPSMAERLQNLMEQRFMGSGLNVQCHDTPNPCKQNTNVFKSN